MLGGYPNVTFTPEKPELVVDLKTGMKITIIKFVINNEGLDFLTDHSLGFQIEEEKTLHPVRPFVNFVSPSHKDLQVVEPNITFDVQLPGKIKIKIVDGEKVRDYSITMVYDIQPL